MKRLSVVAAVVAGLAVTLLAAPTGARSADRGGAAGSGRTQPAPREELARLDGRIVHVCGERTSVPATIPEHVLAA